MFQYVTRKRVVLVVFLAVIVLLVGAVTVYAQAAPPEFATLEGFLFAMSGPMAAIPIGIVIGLVMEYIPKPFENMRPLTKRIIFFLIALAVPLLFALLTAAVGYAPWTVEWFWRAVVAGGVAGSTGTLTHGFVSNGFRNGT